MLINHSYDRYEINKICNLRYYKYLPAALSIMIRMVVINTSVETNCDTGCTVPIFNTISTAFDVN